MAHHSKTEAPTGHTRKTPSAPTRYPSSRLLPDVGYVRLRQIIGNPKATPPVPPIIPVSASHWHDGVRKGRYPKPIKLSGNVTVWRVEDIRALIAKLNGGEE